MITGVKWIVLLGVVVTICNDTVKRLSQPIYEACCESELDDDDDGGGDDDDDDDDDEC